MENEITSEPLHDPQIDDAVSSSVVSNHDLLAEVESLRQSHGTLQSHSEEVEGNLVLTKRQRDDAFGEITKLSGIIEGLSSERDQLCKRIDEVEESFREREEQSVKKFEEELREREALRIEIEVYREKFATLGKERDERKEFLLKCSESIRALKEGLVKLIESVDEEKVIENGDDEGVDSELDHESRLVFEEIKEVRKLVDVAESKVHNYKETRKKEKRQLENSVVSLTEENRDVSSLLRIALVEKEAVEKSLNKLKGNSDQKRVALLSFAGLQRVGFGFMMGNGGNIEQAVDISSASSTGSKSDGSECEEEVVSLASTVEKIMKNLRLEISQLRKSLEETRSDNERLQSLTNKQAQEIAENMLYINELEERERLLAQNIEELLYEIKETETEVARWREACELEVEAGKNEIEERDTVVLILKQELEKTKAALDISNGKLKLKEDLAAAAMAAQAAAETSLELADSRAAGLRDRIEELTRQLEEADGRERRRVRHICWPWRVLKMNHPANNYNAASGFHNIKRMLPEMQALLHYSV